MSRFFNFKKLVRLNVLECTRKEYNRNHKLYCKQFWIQYYIYISNRVCTYFAQCTLHLRRLNKISIFIFYMVPIFFYSSLDFTTEVLLRQINYLLKCRIININQGCIIKSRKFLHELWILDPSYILTMSIWTIKLLNPLI